MLDTTLVSTTIAAMVRIGTTEQQIVAHVVRQFPELTTRELSEALQVATTAVERAVARRH
jgi:uncharacterized protein (DUF433 family)